MIHPAQRGRLNVLFRSLYEGIMRIFSFLFILFPWVLWGQGNYQSQIENHRKSYTVGLLQGPNAPLSAADTKKLQFFAPNESYRMTGTVEKLEGQQPIKMASISGEPESYIAYGHFYFSFQNQDHRLVLYRKLAHIRSPILRDLLFIPFKDATNGETTYGGGRYLDIRMAAIKGNRLTVDFNLAYNPYCVYAEGYNCPLPPSDNTLPFVIEAGEKEFLGN